MDLKEIVEQWKQDPNYQTYFGETKPPITEPTKPPETGNMWQDLGAKYEYDKALADRNQQQAEAALPFGSENMKIAEFRPANARERKLARLAKMVAPGGFKSEGNKVSSRRIEAMSQENRAKAKEKILSEFKPEDWSLQVEDMAGSWPKPQIYDEETQGKIARVLRDERRKDFIESGYENALPFSSSVVERLAWENMNKAATKQQPEYVYHQTPSKNIVGIGASGLVTPSDSILPNFRKNLTGTLKDVANFPEQLDKIFFSDRPGTLDKITQEDNKTLRMKFDKDLKPDIHQEIPDEAWYQTKKPIPPQALEIETAPGQWEALLDYIKRGGK